MLCLTYEIKSRLINNNDDILFSYYSVNVNKICPRILPRIIKRFSRNYSRRSIIYAKLYKIVTLSNSDNFD